jgi:general secretion pathway protein A
MYKQYYRLKEEPFNITPDPAFFFLSPSHKEALASILYGVEKRKGFLSITGEVGSGKTTVLRAYLDQIDTDKIKVVYLFNPNLSFKDLLETILRELGFHAPAPEVFEMVNHLGHVLVEEFRQNRNIVLLIDEAQNIPMETLESLRMLSNLETASSKLIQIVLVGQPELEHLLNRHELRQLKQRIAVCVGIRPLTRDESFQYIEHRLSKAALKRTEIFTPGALKQIVREAEGIPRILNILCDNCLISGYGYQEKPITRRIAKEVIVDVRGRRVSPSSRWGYAAAAMLMLSIGLWGMLSYGGKALLDLVKADTWEKIVLTARAPKGPPPLPVVTPPSSEAVDATTSTKTQQVERVLSAAPDGVSPADAAALIERGGQGGPEDADAGALAPAVIPQEAHTVRTKLARRDDPREAKAAPRAVDHGMPPAEPPAVIKQKAIGAADETAPSNQAERVQAPASSPSVNPESPAGPREKEEPVSMGRNTSEILDTPETIPTELAAARLGPAADPAAAIKQKAPGAADKTAPSDQAERVQAPASPPSVNPESPAGPREKEEPVSMGRNTSEFLDTPEMMPTELVAASVGPSPDPPDPWYRARTLFQQGRIAEAGALWQRTYLASSADLLAIEVELNCKPETLQATFEMLSAPEDFYILPYPHQGKRCYRVRLGPYTTRTEASSRARQIKGAMWYAKPWVKKLVVSSGGG